MTLLHTESSEESGNKTTKRGSFGSQPTNLETSQAIGILSCLISSLNKQTGISYEIPTNLRAPLELLSSFLSSSFFSSLLLSPACSAARLGVAGLRRQLR